MLKESILKFLRDNYQGKDSPIKSKDLCNRFGINGSELRTIVNELRMDKYPICSSRNGYFYALNKDEIKQTINHLAGRIKGIKNAIDGLENLL